MILAGNPQENETKLNQLGIIFPCPGTPASNHDPRRRENPFLVAMSGASYACNTVLLINKNVKLMLPNATSIRSVASRSRVCPLEAHDQTSI